MNSAKQQIEYLSISTGLITSASLIAFFFLMKVLGLVHILELRVLNFGFLLFGMTYAIKQFRSKYPEKMTYLKGIGIGLLTSTTAVGTFAIFVLLYTTVINPSFMDVVQANEGLGIHLNPFIISMGIFIEGTASGFLTTYAIMQYLKPSRLSADFDGFA